jgi:hypothetical protein
VRQSNARAGTGCQTESVVRRPERSSNSQAPEERHAARLHPLVAATEPVGHSGGWIPDFFDDVFF